MRVDRLALAVLLFPVAGYARSGEPTPESPARPYWECMATEVRRFAPKTTVASEAIAAARAGCQQEREALEMTIYAEQIVKGQSAYSAQRIAQGAMAKVDSLLADSLVREALLAK